MFLEEVSENEKLTSTSSSVNSCSSLESIDQKHSFEIQEATVKSDEPPSKSDHQLSQMDSELIKHMNEFRAFTNRMISEWFESLPFNVLEIEKSLNWTETGGRSFENNLCYTPRCSIILKNCNISSQNLTGYERIVLTTPEGVLKHSATLTAEDILRYF